MWEQIWEGVERVEFRKDREPYVWKFYEMLLDGYDFRGKRVLEFGCGTGINSILMALKGARVTFVDTSKKALDIVKGNLDSLGLKGELRCESVFDSKFKGFDFVHCIPGDTEVLVENSKIKIKDMFDGKKSKVIGFDIKNRKMVLSDIKSCVKSGNEMVYKIATESGRSIEATKNHRFYVNGKWERLKDIKIGDKVVVNLALETDTTESSNDIIMSKVNMQKAIDKFLWTRKCHKPHSRYKYKSKAYEQVLKLYRSGIKSRTKLEKITGIPKGSINNWLVGRSPPKSLVVLQKLKERTLAPLRKNSKTQILAKIFGHVFSDGWVSKSGERVRFLVGCEEDAREIISDIKKLGFTCGKIYKRVNKRKMNGKIVTQRVVEFECGNRDFWVLLRMLGAPAGRKTTQSYDIPKWIFSSDVFQRDFLWAFLGGDGEQVKIEKKNSRPVRIRFYKKDSLREDGLNFAKQLCKVLSNLNINVSKVSTRNVLLNNKKMIDFEIRISGSEKNILNLCKIGYAYCRKKDMRARYVGEYLSIKEALLKRRRQLKEKAKKMEKRGFSVKEICKKSGIKKYEYYNWIKYKSKPLMGKSFPTFEEWAKESNSLTDGLVFETIESILPVGKKDVYDIELEKNHNFFANDILVHNSEGLVEHFLGRERQEILDIHARAAKKGGKVLIIVPHRKCPPYRIGKLVAEKAGTWIYHNEHPYTKGELVQRMKKAGLKPGKILGGEFLFSMVWLAAPLMLKSSRLLRKGIGLSASDKMVRLNYGNRFANRWGRVIGTVGEKL